MNNIKLSTIVVSYNTAELTEKCLTTLINEINSDDNLKTSSEIIVVDNHSHDSSVEVIKDIKSATKIPLQIVINSGNLGFAKANNAGIKLARGEYILLLNSDAFLEPESLKILIKTLESCKSESTATLSSYHGKIDNLGILAANLINLDRTPQRQGGNLPSLISLFCHMMFLDDLPIIGKFFPSTQHTGQSKKINKCDLNLIKMDWVGATAMLIKKQVFDSIGLLDEQIFMYGEDIEFCLRAKNHAFDVAICPKAKVVHVGSASSRSVNAIKGEILNYIYIWQKHFPAWQLPIVRTILKVGCNLRIVLHKILRHPEYVEVYQSILKQL
jgi:GT2 family glycosyltransferase